MRKPKGLQATSPGEALHLLDAVQKEHRWMAQRLHDSLSQSLCGLQLLARVKGGPQAGGSGTGTDLTDMIAKAASELREMLLTLRCEETDGEPLAEILADQARQASSHFPCEFQCGNPAIDPGVFASGQLSCILREILGGIARARGRARIRVSLGQRENSTTLEVKCSGENARLPDDRLVRWDLVHLRAMAIEGTVETGAKTVRISVPASW